MKWTILWLLYIFTPKFYQRRQEPSRLTAVKQPEKVTQELPWLSLPLRRKNESLKTYVHFSHTKLRPVLTELLQGGQGKTGSQIYF